MIPEKYLKILKYLCQTVHMISLTYSTLGFSDASRIHHITSVTEPQSLLRETSWHPPCYRPSGESPCSEFTGFLFRCLLEALWASKATQKKEVCSLVKTNYQTIIGILCKIMAKTPKTGAPPWVYSQCRFVFLAASTFSTWATIPKERAAEEAGHLGIYAPEPNQQTACVTLFLPGQKSPSFIGTWDFHSDVTYDSALPQGSPLSFNVPCENFSKQAAWIASSSMSIFHTRVTLLWGWTTLRDKKSRKHVSFPG